MEQKDGSSKNGVAEAAKAVATGVVVASGVAGGAIIIAASIACPPLGVLFGLGILNRLKVRGKI